MQSKRGNEWIEFAAKVLYHIENYTVPQYGDDPNDRFAEMSADEVMVDLKKYLARLGRNQRGEVEQLRDLLKIAHVACVVEAKMRSE
jgi:hypothetical protein